MAVPDATFQALIIRELNLTEDQAVDVPTVWSLYAEKAALLDEPRAPYLYAKCHMIDYLLGAARDVVDLDNPERSQKNSQHVAALLKMREVVQSEITKVEARSRDDRGSVIGFMTAITDPGLL